MSYNVLYKCLVKVENGDVVEDGTVMVGNPPIIHRRDAKLVQQELEGLMPFRLQNLRELLPSSNRLTRGS